MKKEIIKTDKTDSNEPKITKEVIISSSSTLKTNQSEFSKTGGIHASGLLNSKGELITNSVGTPEILNYLYFLPDFTEFNTYIVITRSIKCFWSNPPKISYTWHRDV